MAKYIIDIPFEADFIMVIKMEGGLPVEVKCEKQEELEPYTEPSYKAMNLQHSNDILKVARMNYYKGAEDGWNLAREIAYCMSLQECEDAGMVSEDDIYDSATGVLEKLTYQEAKAKYESWQKQKDEIRVGDEVTICG